MTNKKHEERLKLEKECEKRYNEVLSSLVFDEEFKVIKEKRNEQRSKRTSTCL